MARSLATFVPTRPMRLAGLVAMAGALLLLWGYLVLWQLTTITPFEDRHVNSVRLQLFWTAGAVVALAFHRRQASVHRLLALAATGSVVAVNLANVAWLLLAWDRDSPFMGDFGFAGFVAAALGWLAASFYGLLTLVIGAAWQGMARRWAVAAKAGLGLLLAGPLAFLGMGRLGLTSNAEYGQQFTDIALIGVAFVGLGWLLLGVVLLLGGRRSRP